MGLSETILFPLQHPRPPIPTNLPPLTPPKKRPFRVRFGPSRVRFGSVSIGFLASLGVLGRVGAGSGRGGSVREKNINTQNPPFKQSWRKVRGNALSTFLGVKNRGSLISVPLAFRVSSMSFFSLVFSFPWPCSRCEIPWSFWVFSAPFPGFLRVRQVREILRVFEVFLGVFKKTKGKGGHYSAILPRFQTEGPKSVSSRSTAS